MPSDTAAKTPFQQYLDTPYFANLNGLRFLCIAFVLWHHAPAVDISNTQILQRGFLGVDFFFVLSGFLITTLLLREARRDGSFSLKHFYMRRAVRILPVYGLVVSLVAAYYIFAKGRTELAALLPYYYLFLSNFLGEHIPTLSITWSLAVEEQYYMLWPLLLTLWPRRMLVPVLCLLVAGNVILSILTHASTPPSLAPLVLKLPNATYAPILMGSLLAVLLNRPAPFAYLHRVLAGRYTALVALAATLAAAAFTPSQINGWPNLLIHTLMTATLASLVLCERSNLAPFLQNRAVMRVGEVSYGIYLYHLIALDITNRLMAKAGLTNSWLLLTAYSTLSWLIADISFRTYEAYFQRFRPKQNN